MKSNKKSLTVEDVRAIEKYKNLTDEEALKLIHSIEIYTNLCFQIFMRQEAEKALKKEIHDKI